MLKKSRWWSSTSRNVKETSTIYYRTLCKRPVSTLCYSNTEMSYLWTNTIPRFARKSHWPIVKQCSLWRIWKIFWRDQPPCYALFLRMFFPNLSGKKRRV